MAGEITADEFLASLYIRDDAIELKTYTPAFSSTEEAQKYANKILSFTKPHNTPTLQTFLGLICFCKQYIKNYGKNVALLTDMLHTEKSASGWAWGKEQDDAFEEIRKGIMNPLTLHLIDENATESELHIYTDASDRAYGIVLLQRVVDKDGKPEYRLIDMLSRIIHRNNRDVSILRKEFNSLVLSMDSFHNYFTSSCGFSIK